MKIIFSLLLFVSINLFSQCPVPQVVTDVTANKSLKLQLANSGQQLKQLEDNYAVLQDAKDKYEKVSSIVTSVFELKEIIDLQAEAIENTNLVLNNNNLKGKRLTNMLETLTKQVSSIEKHVTLIDQVLTDGFFDMTDKERVEMFESTREKVFFLTSRTRGYANPYRNR